MMSMCNGFAAICCILFKNQVKNLKIYNQNIILAVSFKLNLSEFTPSIHYSIQQQKERTIF